jgi:hypothetical protein
VKAGFCKGARAAPPRARADSFKKSFLESRVLVDLIIKKTLRPQYSMFCR